MVVVNKEGGLTTRHWFEHATTNELKDVEVGSDEETALAADGNYSTVTSYDTAQRAATYTPTVMP